MISFYGFFSGTVSFSVRFPPDSDNSADLIGRLVRSVGFARVRTEKSVVYGTVKRTDLPRVCSIARSLGAEAEIIGTNGLYYILRRYSKRIGIPLGAFIAAVMLLYLSNIVLRIEISGNSEVSDSEIMSTLNGIGISYGAFIPPMNFRAKEKLLRASSGKIAWAAIRSSGCRIIVQISEITEKPPLVMKNDPCNIVSMYDAQITGITVYSGMLVPMLGDTVRKGSLLVSGVVPEKFGGAYYVHALGSIKGQYRLKAEFEQPYRDTVSAVGDITETSSPELFGRRLFTARIPQESSDHVQYEISESKNYLKLLGMTLPAAVIHTRIVTYSRSEVLYSREQADKLLEEKLMRYENNFLNDGSRAVIDRKTVYTHTKDGAKVCAEYLVEGEIGREQIIFAKKIPFSAAVGSGAN